MKLPPVRQAARDLCPIVDVAAHLRSAIALYEGCERVLAGEVSVELLDGTTLNEFVYLAPASLRPPRRCLFSPGRQKTCALGGPIP